MRIKPILSLILSLGAFLVSVKAQITSSTASSTVSTAYTNATPNDLIFIFCTPNSSGNPVTGALSAAGSGGCGGPYTFTWEIYNSGTNSFNPFTVQNGNSTNISGLASGGYALTVTDNCGTIVLCDVAWVFVNQTTVDAGPAQSGCGGNINLTGTVNPVANFVYYNPPPPSFIVGPSTTITVCFNATHTYVSDLGFYLVGPASCGSPTIPLSPNPGSIGQGSICNSGDNVNNLCFTTSAAPNLNVCTSGTPLTGTYDSYGPSSTPINWAPLYGCDAAAGGWKVQIYDCIGADVGALTNASITFTGNAGCGPNSISYNSGAINSTINDNSCTPASASIYTVPTNPAFVTPITLTNTITSFLWTSNNGTVIPQANSDLTPTIPDPGVDTWFYLQATDNFGCTTIDSVFFDNTCVCNMTGINANVGPCVPATGNYTVTGQVSFSNAPSGGQLVIAGCNGVQQVFNPPFTSPTNYSLTMPANGAACNVTATFTADPACTINVGSFNAPTCPCLVDNFTANIGACSPATNTYQVTGQVQFTYPPSTGQLIVENCDGVQQVFNAPFTSPVNYTLNSCVPNGTACDVQVYFTADPACQQTINFTEPAPCNCSADAGTFTANIAGSSTNNYVLCFGDQVNISSNNDFTYPPDVNDPTIPYNPGIFYLVYSCPPGGGLPNNDPCFEGIMAFNQNFSDVNDMSVINSFPPGTFTNNIVYYVPSTMYNINGPPYYISVTNYAGDCFDLGTPFSVTYLPDITYVSAENCNTGSATFTINGGHAAIFGSNFTASGLTPATASFGNTTCANGGTITINGLQDGDMYSFTITDANGCPVTCTGGPYVAASDATISPAGPFCPGDPAVLLTTVDSGGTWSASCGGCITSGGSFDPAISGPGNHTVTYTIPGACGDIQNRIITVNPLPTPVATNTGPYCPGDAIQLNSPTGNGNDDWTGPNAYAQNNIQNPVIAASTAAMGGVYTVTVTDNNNCSATATTTVVISAVPVAQFAGDTLVGCAPLCVNLSDLTNTNGTTIASWNWNVEGQSPSSNQNVSYCFSNPGQYDATLTVTSTDGCVNTLSLANYITVIPDPVAGILYSPQEIDMSDPEVTFASTSVSAVSWNWLLGDSTTSVLENPVHSYQDTGTYCVLLTVANNFGCTDTASACLYIQPVFSLYIPNAFTPNADNMNEVWSVYGQGIKTIVVRIFDRWGEEIFSFDNINKGWPGTTQNSQPCTQGVYIYRIEVVDSKNDFHQYIGNVNLIR